MGGRWGVAWLLAALTCQAPAPVQACPPRFLLHESRPPQPCLLGLTAGAVFCMVPSRGSRKRSRSSENRPAKAFIEPELRAKAAGEEEDGSLKDLNEKSYNKLFSHWDIDFLSMEISPGGIPILTPFWEVGGSLARPTDSDFASGLEIGSSPFTLRIQSTQRDAVNEHHDEALRTAAKELRQFLQGCGGVGRPVLAKGAILSPPASLWPRASSRRPPPADPPPERGRCRDPDMGRMLGTTSPLRNHLSTFMRGDGRERVRHPPSLPGLPGGPHLLDQGPEHQRVGPGRGAPGRNAGTSGRELARCGCRLVRRRSAGLSPEGQVQQPGAQNRLETPARMAATSTASNARSGRRWWSTPGPGTWQAPIFETKWADCYCFVMAEDPTLIMLAKDAVSQTGRSSRASATGSSVR